MSLSDTSEVFLLNHLLRGIAWPRQTVLHFAVTAAAITDADTGTTLMTKEPSDPAYARIAITCSTSNWTLASTTAGQSQNVNPITFAQATADWLSLAPLAYFALCDAPVNGTVVLAGTLNTTRIVKSGDVFEIPANGCTVTAD